LRLEPGASAGSSELTKRIISSIVLVPVALAAVILGGLPFAAFVVLVGTIGFWEWTAIVRTAAPTSARFAWIGLGLLYVTIPCGALILLRLTEPAGWIAILFILVVVWATDIAAFFGGRFLGGPKLWPRVSPKKTWSGALSGLFAAMAAGGLTALLTRAGHPVTGVIIAIPLSIAAQAGDLLESSLKRKFDVKDSGRIIPGHGGVLDRVDSLFGAAALAWLIAALGLGGNILALPSGVASGAGA
jgi:phosphatidate cytidylyltransferase